jgi:hypothetical protein
MSKTDGMIVELRSTGCQTIAPGSVHPGGEVVRWDADGEPATINPDELLLALTRLANTVRSERASESQRNSNLTTDDPLDPIDPVDPANPVDPVRKLSPEQVIEMARVNGPGQHDSQTLVLARGLRLNAGLPSSDAARPHFDCWWVSACPRCADHDADASWFKFERAWDTVTIPLLAPGIAASVLAIIDRLPDVREAAGFGPKVRRLVNALAEMGRRSGGQPFALSARMVGDALGVSVATAHEWMGGLVRRGLLRCTDRGRPGTDGTGKARRLVWMGCQQATDVVG